MKDLAKYKQLMAELKSAPDYTAVTRILGEICDLVRFQWNTGRSYMHNANIADMDLNRAAAEAFKAADTRVHELVGLDQ